MGRDLTMGGGSDNARVMSETPQDAWFYTNEGEKVGPVTIAELRVKAVEGSLNPRLDMVWSHGMADWKPAGEIEGLFERRAPEIKEALAPAADPYKPPQQESVAHTMASQGSWPGARRRSFLIATILFPFVWQFGFSAANVIIIQQLGKEISAVLLMVAAFVPLVVGVYYGLARLVNLGMSRWWYLGNFVPILNFWISYRCFACPAGYAYHKKLDGPGLALAIIYWLLVLITIILVVGVIALMFGAIGDPGMREKLQEILRTITERTTKP